MAVRSFQQIIDDIAKVQAAVEQKRNPLLGVDQATVGRVLIALSPAAADTLAHLLAHIPVGRLKDAGLPHPLTVSPGLDPKNHRPIRVAPSSLSGQPVIYI